MFIYEDINDLPKSHEIVQYSTRDAPCDFDKEEWLEWIDSQADIIIRIDCSDDVIIIARTWRYQ